MNIFKISLPGNDVKDSKLDQEAVDSLYPSPKVSTLATPPHAGIIYLNWSSANLAFAPATSRTLYSFPHNYDYIPTVFGIHNFDNGTQRLKGMLPFNYGALGLIILDSDEHNVNLQWLSTDFPGTTPVPPFIMQVRFYVFAERGYD